MHVFLPPQLSIAKRQNRMNRLSPDVFVVVVFVVVVAVVVVVVVVVPTAFICRMSSGAYTCTHTCTAIHKYTRTYTTVRTCMRIERFRLDPYRWRLYRIIAGPSTCRPFDSIHM